MKKCDATKAMEDARAGLISKHPSLGYLCFKLKWFPDSTAPTAWTDGISVGFNPEFILSLTKAQRRFLAAHEVGHPMLGHHLRRNERDPRKWNVACDHVINLILASQGFTMIDGAHCDYQFKGMAAEQVYKILFPPGQDEDEDSTEKGRNDDSNPDGPGGEVGEVRDFPGEEAEDFDMEAEKWDMAVQQAAQMERRLSPEGNLPGFVETMLTNISNPKLPWTEILSRWLTSKAKNDYSWTRPNPRYSSTGFFMPSLESHEMGKVALFWDTSGSVSNDQAADIGSESQSILAHFPGVLIDLYHIDVKVRDVEEVNQYTDWHNMTAKGGGGTDFRPGFDAIEHGEEDYPEGVIYMTDGACSKFPEPPPYPVLWVVVDMPEAHRFEPPFGEVAYYNDF
jgi:predicted metal-dependent peptidase